MRIASPLSDFRYPEIPLGVECALPQMPAAPAAALGRSLRRLLGYTRCSLMSKNSATYSEALPSASRTAAIDSQAR